jgi:hypothetical protein
MAPARTSALVRLSPLLALLVVALVPYGWVARFVPMFGVFVDGAFSSDAAHAIGHSLIFAVIGAALLRVFPGLLRRPWLYHGLILLVGIGQEGFQLLYKGRGVVRNDLTDLGIDLVAAATVFALARLWSRRDTARPEGAQQVV